MATVGETLFIALGLDASSAVDSLKQFQNNLQKYFKYDCKFSSKVGK